MAFLRSTAGKLYEVPDEQLSAYEVPSDLLRQIVILAHDEPEGGGVEPYDYRHWSAAIGSPALSAVPAFREGRRIRAVHTPTSRWRTMAEGIQAPAR